MSAVTDSWIRRHRISVDEYYRMAEVGLLTQDARELHRFSNPSGSGYTASASFQGGSIEPAAMPGVQIDLGQILRL